MSFKQKRNLIFMGVGSILFIILSVLYLNESYYRNYKHQIMIYAKDAERVVAEGTDIEKYTEHIKDKLTKSGFGNIVVETSGENLYGSENTISIEVTLPPTKLDKLLHKNVEPIWVEYTFINSSTYL